jgi:hypothetical protein
MLPAALATLTLSFAPAALTVHSTLMLPAMLLTARLKRSILLRCDQACHFLVSLLAQLMHLLVFLLWR